MNKRVKQTTRTNTKLISDNRTRQMMGITDSPTIKTLRGKFNTSKTAQVRMAYHPVTKITLLDSLSAMIISNKKVATPRINTSKMAQQRAVQIVAPSMTRA